MIVISNKDLCIEIINGFEEEQPKNIAVLLRSIQSMVAEVADDAFCIQLVNDYENDTDDNKKDFMSIQDFSRKLGIVLK